jgi:NADPH-dependent 2,4-dienoyl-CoA reductase/sulfur reductase-like enzyme
MTYNTRGLEFGKLGGIVVNEKMETSDPDIYAAGDVIETVQLVTGAKTKFPLAGPANKQGRVVGANAVGGSLRFKGALGTSIVECLGVVCGMTGMMSFFCHDFQD